ncbi:hypothetical protein SAPIO_CDS3459 [Scedosporium apiospermum]|uniref:Uncharacterized protein n=1 Tax=Pseudallescheria apiosperma TaxID=563466 RepID=A0A084GAU1_PSEDA|nr:uncharacterized protein SAPIO_CDS3459 [Scedosporium apiospermum]KEZ44453.1 hypothetical protein SAPIO_CDS3459 [Scedosporium apiospermum]
MNPRILAASRALRAGFTARGFQTSSRLSSVAAALPASKPVGAFRSGILGFFAGTTIAGFAAYSYVRQEFKTANDLLLEDLYVRLAI